MTARKGNLAFKLIGWIALLDFRQIESYSGYFYGCPSGIRTPICCSRGSCPTIERRGNKRKTTALRPHSVTVTRARHTDKANLPIIRGFASMVKHDSCPTPGQTHLEAQALDLVREMLFRGESRWKTEHVGMVWVGEFRCAKSAIFCSKVPVSMVFLAFFCLEMGVCVYR